MNKYGGITMGEVLQAMSALSKVMNQYYDEREMIFNTSGSMSETHFITISKEQFDRIKIGDRLIIQNEEDNICYVVYVEDNSDEDD